MKKNFETLKNVITKIKTHIDFTTLKISFHETFRLFAKDTTIHGIKHIFMNFNQNELRGKFSYIKIICNEMIWITSVLLNTIFCLYLIGLTYENYNSVSTTTTIETTNYPISEVSFPAVTICTTEAVHLPAAERIIKIL